MYFVCSLQLTVLVTVNKLGAFIEAKYHPLKHHTPSPALHLYNIWGDSTKTHQLKLRLTRRIARILDLRRTKKLLLSSSVVNALSLVVTVLTLVVSGWSPLVSRISVGGETGTPVV